MRRLTSTIASFALVAAGMVALAVNTPASADPTPAVTLASGDSGLPDLQTLLTANDNGYVYETLNAANQPTLWAQKLNGGAADGDPIQLTGGNFTHLTSNGFRPGLNLSIAGSMIAAAGDTFTSFGSEQQRISLYDLATDTATNPIITGFSDGGGFSNQVFFAGAAPDGMLFLNLTPAADPNPATVHVMDEDQARDAPVDLGALPDASGDPTLLADVTAATSPTGSVIAYPTTTVVDGATQDNLIFVPYNGDPFTVLATGGHGSFSSSLMTGGGNVAWANYLLAFFGGNGGCNYYTLPLDGSGGGTPTDYNPANFCDELGGITDTKMVLSPFPIFAGQGSGDTACPATIQTCASGKLATLNLLDGTVTKSTSQNALSAATDGTSLYFSQGTALGTSGIYQATSATSAASLFAAARTKPLWATSVSAAPGQISWTDDSTTSYPVQSRTVSNNGTTLDLGTAQPISDTTLPLTADDGYGISTSGKRTAYAAPPASGNLDRLLVAGPGGDPQLVTNYSDGTPSMNFRDPEPGTVQVSGSNVLYLTNDPNGGYDGHVYSTVTHQTQDFPAAAAYALSGGYLAWLGEDGSVSRQDLVAHTGPDVLRPATTLTTGQTVSISGQVAAAGDYVSWLVRECIQNGGSGSCTGNTEAAYRNAKTMDAATTVVTAPTTPDEGTTPTTPENIAMSADYLVLDELNPTFSPNAHALVAVKLADNTSSTVTSSNAFVSGAGKFAVDGSTVAWIDPTGAPMAKGLDTNVDVPRTLTVDAPASLDIGTAAPFELVASTGFFNCGLTITNGSDQVVRSIDCTDDTTDGDVIVNWDGTDDSAQPLPAGAYTWTLNVASAGGNLEDYTGVEGPATGTVNLVNSTTTTPTWPASITYGQGFSVDVTVTSTAGTPTGTVTLSSGDTIDTEPLSGGTATLTAGGTALTPGNHTLTVSYTGSDTFAASSASQDFTVHKATSTLAATFPSSKPIYGKSWTVKVTVGAQGVTPTGTVTLKNGNTTLGSHALSGGKATITVAGTKLKPGKHTLTLSYGGSSTVLSKTITKTLTVAKADATVHEALNVTQVRASRHAKLTVRVTATGGVPVTGVVRVFSGTTQIAKVLLTRAKDGRVVITLPRLNVGKHRIHATYSGSPTVKSAAGATLTLTVTRA